MTKRLNALLTPLVPADFCYRSSTEFLDCVNSAPAERAMVYIKPTILGLCLSGESECPQRYKDSTITSFYRRALTHCSSWTSTQEFDRATQMLVNNGHPNQDCQRVLRTILNKWYEGQQAVDEEGTTHSLFYRAYMSSAYHEEEIFKDCTPYDAYIEMTTTKLSRRLSYHLTQGGHKRHFLEKHGQHLTRDVPRQNTALIKQEEKHVILLQETLMADEEVRVSGYHVFVLPQTATTRGCMTLVHASIPCSRVDPPIDGREGAEVLAVQLLFPQETVHAYNIYRSPTHGHLDLGELCTVAEKEKYIVAGDFNAHHPILHSVTTANSTGRHIEEVLSTTPGVALLNDGSPTHVQHGRLDLSLASSSLLHRMSWGVNDTVTSDHFGIDMTLTVASPPPLAPRVESWNVRRANWKLFSEKVTAQVSTETPSTGDLDGIEAFLTSAIHAAAAESIPRTAPSRRNHRNGWFYNQDIKKANHRVNTIRKTLRRHRNPANLANLRTAVEEAREVARRTYTHCHAPVELQRTQARLSEARRARIQAAIQSPGNTDTPFTLQEPQSTYRTSTDTAPGSDRVTYSMITHLGDAGEKALLQLVNTSWLPGRIPYNWKQADIVPVPKPKESGKYRFISLTSCLGKNMEKMVLRRLQWKLGPPPENLNGFARGIGTAHCIATLLSHVERGHAVVVFFDLEKAFELANPDAILEDLATRETRGRLLQSIADCLSNRRARVRLQGAVSSYHPLENGTP
ncbi:uncharacterized protein LOC143028853 [Oratosquilla oratoria]|uniref:uncharacterized protein LOC143028853 n=1 Tax=Oratosquilla oratoria TaxID=337810 RepID=UPI003F773DF1